MNSSLSPNKAEDSVSGPDDYDAATRDSDGKPLYEADGVRDRQLRRIDRYLIDGVLGKGGFGIVYRALDEQLGRRVAIKVPHARRITCPEDVDTFLDEARTVAGLDHPGIVPVYDVGSTKEYPCFIVSRYIEGPNLAELLRKSRLGVQDVVRLVATVAEALQDAHRRGLVHRDVKPGNILLDAEGKPFVTDFGLALSEHNVGRGHGYAGTAAYMSPEQARGEGHRVDGRSDIFSLGVVLYESLAGRSPFRGKTQAETLDRVISLDPRPLQQYDEAVPAELDRICHKALAKRAKQRYASAHEMAEDLRVLLATLESTALPGVSKRSTFERDDAAPELNAVSSAPTTATASSGTNFLRIVPKGLRPFDAHDADFFLQLLSGPRDRDGLPDILRFWKNGIEETVAEDTFPVGLIYGPSGCGKSSLVRAGLLPRLKAEITSVYVEATPDKTETRLLHGIRRHCPTLDDQLDLKESLMAIRQGQGIPYGESC